MNLDLRYFNSIYIINLPDRSDRRQEIEQQLRSVGLDLSSPIVRLFPAIRPQASGGFSSIGAHGCFLSHLEVLKEAKSFSHKRILILEDDLNFSRNFEKQLRMVIAYLQKHQWSIFYGGHGGLNQFSDSEPAEPAFVIPPEVGIPCSHMIAFQGQTICDAITYLEAMLGRPPGSTEGGPMHVDGAYSWFRRYNPQHTTIVANPVLGYQRASKTDIHDLKWYDRLFITSFFIRLFRVLKNRFS